jgi:hypothetical protein
MMSAFAALTGPATLTASDAGAGEQETVSVSGGGVDRAREAIVHWEKGTPNGMIRRVTAIVKLTGDVSGYVLYQPMQEFDCVNNQLVVTGANFSSGTIEGSESRDPSERRVAL